MCVGCMWLYGSLLDELTMAVVFVHSLHVATHTIMVLIWSWNKADKSLNITFPLFGLMLADKECLRPLAAAGGPTYQRPHQPLLERSVAKP